MTMLSPQELAEASAAKLNQRDKAAGHIGLAVEAVAPTAAVVAVSATPTRALAAVSPTSATWPSRLLQLRHASRCGTFW